MAAVGAACRQVRRDNGQISEMQTSSLQNRLCIKQKEHKVINLITLYEYYRHNKNNEPRVSRLKAIKSEVVCLVLFTEKDTEKFVNEAFLLWWYII